MILSKLKTSDIIEKVQLVCMLFRKICKQPAMFKIIDTYLLHSSPRKLDLMTRFAVDRSAGGLVDITLPSTCNHKTLMYIVDRSNLKRLVLPFLCLFYEWLIEAVKKLPMLEELHLIVRKILDKTAEAVEVHYIICNMSDETVETVGRACPSLMSFSINQEVFYADFVEFGNEDSRARAIGRSMPQLRHLQLIGNRISDKGLRAILDGCPLLESLDLRECFQLNFSGNLGERCEKIKHVRYPYCSMSDYPWLADYREWKEPQYENSGCNILCPKMCVYDESQDDEESEYICNNMMGPFIDMFDYDYSDLQEGDYDDFFRDDENYRLYRDHNRGALFGYESSD